MLSLPTKTKKRAPASSPIARLKDLPTRLRRPWMIVLIVTLVLVGHIVLFGRLVYGDIPDYSVQHSTTNAFHAWGPQQFGTPVRQGLNTLRDVAILTFARFDFAFYFVKYILPIILVPLVYYWLLRRVGISNRVVLVGASLFPLFTPIVFGDFLTGQTFWIYLTVPFVLYYSVRLFCWQQFSSKNGILLAVWLFLSLGMLPPIIVPLIAAVGLMAAVLFLTHIRQGGWQLVGGYAKSCGIAAVTFGLLAAPYLLVASSGQAAYTPPSLLGDYYHNYAATNLMNTLRMAGNNGSGQSTLGYNVISPITIIGFLLAIGMFTGALILGLTKRLQRYQAMILGLLTVLLSILCFMHLLNTQPLLGVKVFESQWLVSTVRNPSKLYVIMLPIFVLLFAFSLQFFLARFRGRVATGIITVCAAATVGAYGWPALRGDLGLLYGREDKLSNYHASPTVQDVIARVADRTDRSLLIPANHRDELNYQFLAPGFNILGLEGSLPHTSQVTKGITGTFNDRNPYFFHYLETAGVKNVFIQKSSDAYKQSLFSLFSVTLTPEQARDFAASRLRLAGETAAAWHFVNDRPSPLVYSPSTIIAVDNSQDLQTKAPFLAQNTALVENANGYKSLTTHFSTKENLAKGETIAIGKAQLHDANLLLVDLYQQTIKGKPHAVFDIIDPLTNKLQRSVRHEIPAGGQIITIGEDRYTFSPQKQRLAVRAGDYQAAVGSLEPVPAGATDPSFESAPSKIVDVTPRADGNAQLYTRRVTNDRTQGRSSLLIGADKHRGLVTKDLPATDPNAWYVVSFDYKNSKGSELSYGVWQDGQSLLLGNGTLANSPQWQRQAAFFQIDPETKAPPQLFFYTGDQNQPSENLVDNVQLFKVADNGTIGLSLPNYAPDVDLRNYQHQETTVLSTANLVSNGSFEDARLWGKVGDATAGASGDAIIKAAQTNDAAMGSHALELSSSNHTAFAAAHVANFQRNSVYKLSFQYKHVSGRKPAFAIWQNGAEIARPSGELRGTDNEWNTFETYFIPDKATTSITLYLYSRSIGDKTINLFDDVRVTPASLVATYFSQESNPAESPANLVAQVTRDSPTDFTITAQPGKGMIVLNESYHKGWTAHARPAHSDKSILLDTHVEANGFVNGWWIDSSRYPELGGGQYTITLHYEPQNYLSGGLVSTGITALAVTSYLAYERYRKEYL